jgi:predicted  nucleic acid-binding Zn-ribbon protein
VTRTFLLCMACGERWVSSPAIAATHLHGGCLRCGNELLETVQTPEPAPEGDPHDSPSEADGEGDRPV